MNLIERVKNMITTPKTEWEVVKLETATPVSLLTGYIVPLSAIACLGVVLSYLLYFNGSYGYSSGWLIRQIVISFISYVLTYYISVIVIDMLAPSFASEKDKGKSAQLVAYSLTPVLLGAFLTFIPVIGWLIGLAGLVYGVYLLYLGIGPLKKTPEDKKIVYILVSAVIIFAIYLLLAAVLAMLIRPLFGIDGYSGYRY